MHDLCTSSYNPSDLDDLFTANSARHPERFKSGRQTHYNYIDPVNSSSFLEVKARSAWKQDSASIQPRDDGPVLSRNIVQQKLK